MLVQACVHISTGVATTKTDRGGGSGGDRHIISVAVSVSLFCSTNVVADKKLFFAQHDRIRKNKKHFSSLFLLSSR